MDRRVLVVGGGIAGIQASLDLAQMGIPVTLVEEQPSIGGRMAQLDKTFPTNDCSTCILSPKLVELAWHPKVDILAYSVLEEVDTRSSGFQVRIRRKARYVNEEKCTACGLCSEKCPVWVNDRFNKGIGRSKCISMPYAQAVPAVFRIQAESCLYLTRGKCGACQKVCPAGAVEFDQKDRIHTLEVQSIILAMGAEEYPPRIRPEYGYGIYPNVVTSIEYERYLSASGPTSGQIRRPSDGREPERVAFLQCVGSRESQESGLGYCSAYCCMQATKDALITKEHLRDAEVAIFYIDIRAFGKEFDRFVDRARYEQGVRYIQSRVSEICENPHTRNLIIKYVGGDGGIREEEFGLAVLSVGIRVPENQRRLLSRLGVKTEEHGFCLTSPACPVETTKEGIYACGTITAPMDIPETVVSASAAAAMASRGMLRHAGGKDKKEGEKKEPEELSVYGYPPRVGLIVCRCGVNIGSVVDVPAVVESSCDLEQVVFAEEMTYACSQDSIHRIASMVREHRLNRLVVASCTPRTHEPLFQRALQNAGVNRYLLQMANIREQCAWVHREFPEVATEKAKELVRMAVARARRLEPLYEMDSQVNKSCLVIGGGAAGMSASIALADNGFQTYLVEGEERLGGNLRRMHSSLDVRDPAALLEELETRVRSHPKIEAFLNSEVIEIEGYVGSFSSRIADQDGERRIQHGAVILATGAREHRTQSYGYNEEPYVVTQTEFDGFLGERNPLLQFVDSVAMIQCVDSREGERSYCSRMCCSQAVGNALRFLELYPRRPVYVLYRDMRTYGLLEPWYAEARRRGVVFIRYPEEERPSVESSGNGEFLVRVQDALLGRHVTFTARLVVLSVGIDPAETNQQMARLLKVPLNQDGFFQEAHVKLRPVEFATDGVFACGLAHGPKHIRESIAQAVAASARAMTVLSRDTIRSEAATAVVNERRCTGCGSCAEVCPYGAIELDADRGVAVVNRLLCKGCGACAASCLCGAIDALGSRNLQILKQLEQVLA